MRAGYAVSRTGRESQLPRLFKHGTDDYLPDFMIRKAVERSGSWPELYLIFVTDNPQDGRSCFQAIDVAHEGARAPEDLDKVGALGIYPSTVREYEHLVRKLFALFDR